MTPLRTSAPWRTHHGLAVVVVSLQMMAATSALAQELKSGIPLPPGITVRLTLEGPVFVDAAGMTLYKADIQSGAEECDQKKKGSPASASQEGEAADSLLCSKKRIPLRAREDDKAVGKWTIHRRNDGSRQWAYGGAPLYTSIKDTAPGETNGSYSRASNYPWRPAVAPLAAPPGISFSPTSRGIALADETGRPLYYKDKDELDSPAAHWIALRAPMLAAADSSEWSVVFRKDRSRQWAYRGRPLYTYANDSSVSSDRSIWEVFGSAYGSKIAGWNLVLLQPAPSTYPQEVRVRVSVEIDHEQQSSLAKRMYTNHGGMTLYTIHCTSPSFNLLDCDDLGDNPDYWNNFCGGQERCMKTWRPLVAPANARPIGYPWTLKTIDRRHPWKRPESPEEALRVWAFKGRPVFTYANDRTPGDYYGAPGLQGYYQGMHAEIILAYAEDEAGGKSL